VRKLNSRSLEKLVGGYAAVAMMENDCAPESGQRQFRIQQHSMNCWYLGESCGKAENVIAVSP
jgi:hypothetical protein